MKSHNKRLTSNVKCIYTTGIAGSDELLPIYNEKGIEAANAFDIKKNYICEFAIDLKLLGISVDSSSKFSYHIIVNGEPNKYSILEDVYNNAPRAGKNADGTNMSNTQVNEAFERLRTANDPGSATTDFWGEYTLAK